MKKRNITTIILLIVVIALFAIRWPSNVYISDIKTWGDNRPPKGAGTTFFTSVFRGGGGTPAVLAMLGGQRYMVANILWHYQETLFHKGKLYEMVAPLDAVVTLNPSFYEAWSLYGWHLAWNIYYDSKDMVQRKQWLEAGTNTYIRAVRSNPEKPNYYFDLAWLYMQREGNYRKALEILEPIVFPKGDEPVFEARTKEELKRIHDENEEYLAEMEGAEAGEDDHDHSGHDHSYDDNWTPDEKRWDPNKVGRLLAITYQKLAVQTGDSSYLEKAIKTYEKLKEVDPYNTTADERIKVIKERVGDIEWLKEQQENDRLVRKNFELPVLEYNKKIELLYPDVKTGIEDLKNKTTEQQN